MAKDFRDVVGDIAKEMGGEHHKYVQHAPVVFREWFDIVVSEKGCLMLDAYPNGDSDGGEIIARAQRYSYSNGDRRYGTVIKELGSIEATSLEVEKIRSFISEKLEEAKARIAKLTTAPT